MGKRRLSVVGNRPHGKGPAGDRCALFEKKGTQGGVRRQKGVLFLEGKGKGRAVNKGGKPKKAGGEKGIKAVSTCFQNWGKTAP